MSTFLKALLIASVIGFISIFGFRFLYTSYYKSAAKHIHERCCVDESEEQFSGVVSNIIDPDPFIIGEEYFSLTIDRHTGDSIKYTYLKGENLSLLSTLFLNQNVFKDSNNNHFSLVHNLDTIKFLSPCCSELKVIKRNHNKK